MVKNGGDRDKVTTTPISAAKCSETDNALRHSLGSWDVFTFDLEGRGRMHMHAYAMVVVVVYL